MKIDPKEIERIIDDFETKAAEDREILKRIPQNSDPSEAFFRGKIKGLKYAAEVLRQVL
jgi:hypothetical protein